MTSLLIFKFKLKSIYIAFEISTNSSHQNEELQVQLTLRYRAHIFLVSMGNDSLYETALYSKTAILKSIKNYFFLLYIPNSLNLGVKFIKL